MEKLAVIQKGEILEIRDMNVEDFDTEYQRAIDIYGESDLILAYVTTYAVVVGDTYNEGMFFHEGNRVYSSTSLEYKIADLERRVSALEG